MITAGAQHYECSHCSWQYESTPESALEQARIHALIHPGGIRPELPRQSEITHPDPPATNGGTPRPKTKPWNRDEVIAATQTFIRNTGRAPRTADMNNSNGLPRIATITSLFGGIRQLHAAAGLTARKPPRKPRPPAKKPKPQETPAPSLVQLAQAVDDARRQYEQAQTELARCTVALHHALEAAVAALPEAP